MNYYTETHTHARTHARTHTHTHTRTRTHTHTHTHTPPCSPIRMTRNRPYLLDHLQQRKAVSNLLRVGQQKTAKHELTKKQNKKKAWSSTVENHVNRKPFSNCSRPLSSVTYFYSWRGCLLLLLLPTHLVGVGKEGLGMGVCCRTVTRQRLKLSFQQRQNWTRTKYFVNERQNTK